MRPPRTVVTVWRWRYPHDRQNPLSNKRVFSIMIIALSDPPANAGLGGTSRGTACNFAKSSRFENGISKSHHDSQIERVGTRLIIATGQARLFLYFCELPDSNGRTSGNVLLTASRGTKSASPSKQNVGTQTPTYESPTGLGRI